MNQEARNDNAGKAGITSQESKSVDRPAEKKMPSSGLDKYRESVG